MPLILLDFFKYSEKAQKMFLVSALIMYSNFPQSSRSIKPEEFCLILSSYTCKWETRLKIYNYWKHIQTTQRYIGKL